MVGKCLLQLQSFQGQIREDEPVRFSIAMASNNEVSEIEALPDEEFTFSDTLISTIDFVFDDESLPTTFILDDDVIELIGAQVFPCNLCQRICRSKSGLEVHIERNHYS